MRHSEGELNGKKAEVAAGQKSDCTIVPEVGSAGDKPRHRREASGEEVVNHARRVSGERICVK
jgi:hypothetical protein